MNHTELTIDDTTVVSHLHMHMRDKQVGRLLVISKWVGNSWLASGSVIRDQQVVGYSWLASGVGYSWLASGVGYSWLASGVGYSWLASGVGYSRLASGVGYSW